MRRKTKAIWYLGAPMWAGLLASAVFVAVATAGENQATLELVRRVAVEDAELWKEAPNLYASIAADSIFKPVASQAMALIYIRQGNYSNAWKLLAAQSSNLSSASVPYRLGHEKLMLWLLLEAGALDKAESQFKRLVMIAISKDLQDPERHDLCHFLGGVIGMQTSEGASQPIEATTLDNGKVAIETLESKLSVEQFKVALQASYSWSSDLQTKVKEFMMLGPQESQLVLESQQKEVENALMRQSSIKDDLRAATQSKDVIEDERKKLFANQNRIEKAWNTPTPGKPREPSRPTGAPPREPSKVYKTDSKTGKRTYDSEANARNEQEFRRDRENYERRLRNYQNEMANFAVRLNQWKQLDAARRVQLRADRKMVDDALKAKQPEVDAAQEAFKAQLALSKESNEAAKQMQRSLIIATIAAQNLNATNSTQSLNRPANFQILNFESEVFRLQKCLRESNR